VLGLSVKYPLAAAADDPTIALLRMGMAVFFLDRTGGACKIENIYSYI
jgi:hypothetical protein